MAGTQSQEMIHERLKEIRHEPRNLESSFRAMENRTTANADFYVRNHFSQPQIAEKDWRVRIEGAVQRTISWSLEDLRAMTSATHEAVLECAGNGRFFLKNVYQGLQWELGAVGCAEWTGIALKDVLASAGVASDAQELIFEGADSGIAEKSNKPKTPIHFARSLPVAAVERPEVMLAYEMNGESLPVEHGGPVRLIVPGWYGTASVKWLQRIIVAKERFRGYFQTVEYAYWADGKNGPERVPIAELHVKSQITRPTTRERVPVKQPYRIRGVAWSSQAKIAKVEMSMDGGGTWHAATLLGTATQHGWQLWEWEWRAETVGWQVLMSRATDDHGRTQPAEHDANYESYMTHHALPVEVEVA